MEKYKKDNVTIEIDGDIVRKVIQYENTVVTKSASMDTANSVRRNPDWVKVSKEVVSEKEVDKKKDSSVGQEKSTKRDTPVKLTK
jgi:hypothetical protein